MDRAAQSFRSFSSSGPLREEIARSSGESQLILLLRQWALSSSDRSERAFKLFLVRAGIDEGNVDRLLAAFRKHESANAFDVDGFVQWLFRPKKGGYSKQPTQDDVYSVPLHPRTKVDGDRSVAVSSWNVAAINNNPFEYWLTVDDPSYLELMDGVETLIDQPGVHDIPVDQVFTQDMFDELKELMTAESWDGLDVVEEMWNSNFRQRRIITGFLKDKEIGAKRLISMPDRVTNTVNVVTASQTNYKPPPVFRPAVINNYEGDMCTVSTWWEQWKRFFFSQPLTCKTKLGVETQRPCEMMETIPRSKYPALTEAEEKVCVPLQVLCLAIFDSILVHIMTTLSPDGEWQNLKGELCERLYRQKHRRTVEILATSYRDVEVICLQEVAGVFVETLGRAGSLLAESHAVILPEKLDGKRDQNSLILLRKDLFDLSTVVEVTDEILQNLCEGISIADGDLIAITVTDLMSNEYLLMSFHGDTDGKLSVPLVQAVSATNKEKWGKTKSVILALDANVYYPEKAKGKVTIDDFMKACNELGYTSCWGDRPDENAATTCCARTFLQPQLNKAVRSKERTTKGDCNPKDIIVFMKDQFETDQLPSKDNTGRHKFFEKSMFPTTEFPSDHGIITAVLKKKGNPQGE